MMRSTVNHAGLAKARVAFLLMTVVLALGGCATMTPSAPGVMKEKLVAVEYQHPDPIEHVIHSRDIIPSPLVPYVEQDSRSGSRDRVLNDMEAGTVAFYVGAIRQAHALFKDAYKQIDTIYADNPAAKAARSNFVPEANKDFKGEAYERSLVGYYLGLTYMIEGDLENARAAFKWGEYQDTMSAQEKYRSDMALMMYMEGWSSMCLGEPGKARDSFDRARAIRSDLPLPGPDDKMLMIAEVGSSPIKYDTGKYHEALRFKRGQDDTAAVTFNIHDRAYPGALAEDVYFQASTLGGRAVDKILAGKAKFKKNAKDVAAATAGMAVVSANISNIAALNNDQEDANIFGAASNILALGSLVSSAVAGATKPEADTRYWKNLPDKIVLAVADAHGATPTLDVDVGSHKGHETGNSMSLYKTGDCALSWARDRALAPPWNSQDRSGWVEVKAIPKRGRQSVASASTAYGRVKDDSTSAGVKDNNRIVVGRF